MHLAPHFGFFRYYFLFNTPYCVHINDRCVSIIDRIMHKDIVSLALMTGVINFMGNTVEVSSTMKITQTPTNAQETFTRVLALAPTISQGEIRYRGSVWASATCHKTRIDRSTT